MSCGYLSSTLVGPVRAFAHDFTGDLGPPVGAIRRDLRGDPCAFDASDLPALSKQRSDEGGNPPDIAAEDARSR
jgi:hypothetical protein